jgi:Ran GTPase-activating protein (RanGAP) involved in mRNA processing and transport
MDEYKKNVIDLINKHKASLPKEEEERNVDLEDKLAQDHEFDVIGIMNLASTNLTDNDMPMIIQRAFCEKKKCRGLILRDNALTSAGVKMLVDAAISMRTNLRYLSFSDNKDIGDEGIEHVIRLLQKSRSMTFLAIPNTGMTDRGVRLLADLLCGVDADSQCAPLEKLYISFNKSITDESLDAVLQILGQNQTLKVFSIQHCSFSDKARRQLRQVGTKMKKRKFSLAE